MNKYDKYRQALAQELGVSLEEVEFADSGNKDEFVVDEQYYEVAGVAEAINHQFDRFESLEDFVDNVDNTHIGDYDFMQLNKFLYREL